MIIDKSVWYSDNGKWKIYGVVTLSSGIKTCLVRIMKLKNGRHEFYYGKQIPNYVLKMEKQIYEDLKA